MNGEKTSWVEGKRKFITGLITSAMSLVGLFGVSVATQNAVLGVIAAILPVLLGIAYMIMDERARKIDNGTTPKVETPAQGDAVKSTATAVNNTTTPAPDMPVRLPPNVDTMPPFDASDGELNNAQLDLIRAWYMKPVTDKPSLPDVSVGTPNRIMTAQNEIAMEALTVFPGRLADEVLSLRNDCSEKIWMRINFHSAEARRRWINYGWNLWSYREGIALI